MTADFDAFSGCESKPVRSARQGAPMVDIRSMKVPPEPRRSADGHRPPARWTTWNPACQRTTTCHSLVTEHAESRAVHFESDISETGSAALNTGLAH